jgi:hypothetical protein
MATSQRANALQQRIVQQLLGPIDDGLQLARRYRELDGLRDYVGARLRLVIPAGLLILVAAIACGLTPVVLLVGTRPGAALAGLLLAPVVLAGSLFVLAYVFFAWLEERSLAKALGHRTGPAPGKVVRWIRRKLRADLGKAPPVPWLLAALFVIAPLALLAGEAPAMALILIALLALAPIVYARLDR